MTLWLWPFDLEQLSYMAGHATNPATKFKDPMTIRSWVRCYNISRWLPLKCVCGHCACAESRDLWVEGQKQLHFWNPRPRFSYSLYNFYWATTMIKGRLLSIRPMLKPFSGERIKSRQNGAQNVGFGGNGGLSLWYWFRDPQKALACEEPRRLTYYASKSVRASRL